MPGEGEHWSSAEDEEEVLWETGGEHCAQALVDICSYVWHLFSLHSDKNTEHNDIILIT